MRRLEKLAAAAGGCLNHRFGLYDAILIKNNHITAAGGVREAYVRCLGKGLPVEIEVRSFEEIDEALSAGAESSAARQSSLRRSSAPSRRARCRPRQARNLR